MAQISQSKYDQAVAGVWKAKTDAYLKKNNITVKRSGVKKGIKKTVTPFWEVVAETGYDINSGWAGRVVSVYEASQPWFSIEKTIAADKAAAEARWDNHDVDVATDTNLPDNAKIGSQITDSQRSEAKRAAAARRKAARLKRQYNAAVKKAGWSENLLSLAEKRYGVNSAQYRSIKGKVNKYEWGPKVATFRENPTKKKVKAVNENKWLSPDQYNALLKKYGDIQWVISATKNQFGKNSSQAKKIETLLNNFSGDNTKKKIRENKIITDSNLKSPDEVIEWVGQSDYKGNSIVDYLKSINKVSSFSARAKLAKGIWIQWYIWSAAQNKQILDRLRNRKPWESIDNIITNSKVDSGELPESSREDQVNPDFPEESDTIADEELTTEEDTPKIKASEENIEALKKLRLSWKTDEVLLKRVEDKFGKDSEQYKKLKAFMSANPLADSTEWVDSDLLDSTKEELDESQINALEAAKDENIAQTAEDFINAAEVISANNEELQSFYKDMAVELKQFIEDNRARRVKASERAKDSELNKVVGQIRATLARRWVEIGNIPPEQLIAMSGELWAEAMRKINEATTEMEDSVAELTQRKTAEINKLVEQGLIKQGEADASIEQMRELKNKMIADIKSNFVSNTFKITQASVADADQNRAQALNTVSTFVTQLGISGAAQGVMEDYLDSADSVEALENMITDLNDTNSRLFKAVDDAAKAAQLAAEFKAKIEIMKATKNTSSGSNSWAGTTRKIGEATMRSLIAEGVPNASSYSTYGQLESAMNADPDLKAQVTAAISKANAISVSGSDS